MCVRMFGFVDASSGLAQARFECVAPDKPDRGLAGEVTCRRPPRGGDAGGGAEGCTCRLAWDRLMCQ